MKDEYNWEEEFDEKFGTSPYSDKIYPTKAKPLKDFIAKTLEQQKAEEQLYYSHKLKEQKEFITNKVKQSLIEKIESKKERLLNYRMEFNDMRVNTALKMFDDILQSLKEE